MRRLLRRLMFWRRTEEEIASRLKAVQEGLADGRRKEIDMLEAAACEHDDPRLRRLAEKRKAEAREEEIEARILDLRLQAITGESWDGRE
jgi:hypothetical protein